jgi:biofilm PGA synthesis lipoprotein PgaB
MTLEGGTPVVSREWCRRLSPFSAEAQRLMAGLYEDLALRVPLDGVVFHEDGYLTDDEDLNPHALQRYKDVFGRRVAQVSDLSEKEKQAWTRLKTAQVNRFLKSLAAVVHQHRPNARFFRTLYAPCVHFPQSEAWLAQNFSDTLDRGFGVVLLADPEVEDIDAPLPWLEALVKRADRYAGAVDRTVFQLRTYDRVTKQWIPTDVLKARIDALTTAGARHVAYGPDDFRNDKPASAETARALQSVQPVDRAATK